ncbi:MAG: 1-phosphofructokinase [Acidihalobacter sp.]|jgi:1-phosphofructokinase
MSDSAQTVVTVTLNPAIDQTASIPDFTAGAVNRVESVSTEPGGKGVNVASFLADLGHASLATGLLGSDNAEPFQNLFERKGITDRFVRVAGATRVNVKIVDPARDEVTDINFPGLDADEEVYQELLTRIEALSHEHRWFVCAGSVPRGLPAGVYRELLEQLRAAGARVVLDTSGAPLREAIAAVPFAVKPNIEELQELVGRTLDGEAAILGAARDLLTQGIGCVVVSMGERGAYFVEPGDCLHAQATAPRVLSTVGAGDAMVAGWVAGRLRGLDPQGCARLATACSVGTLGQTGLKLPPQQELERIGKGVAVRAVA